MASPPKKIRVDWTTINVWCCGGYHHIDDIAEHAELKHSNGEKVANNNENLHIGDLAEHVERVHSQGEKVLIDESSEKKRKLNLDKSNENYNFVVSNKKFENSMRENDKRKDNRKYYCDSCEYSTTQKYNLRIHTENKHLGIRHLCEVCQFRSTTKAGLNRHRRRIHGKTEIKQEIGIADTFQKIATDTASLFQSGYNGAEIKQEVGNLQTRLDDAEIKEEVLNPMLHKNLTAALSLSPNGNVDNDKTKQEIVSERPTLLNNQMVSISANVLAEVKEEVDEENIRVPGWRVFPECEHLPLNERKKALADGKTGEFDNVFVEEQAAIEKLHAKLEKKEKDSKKWDAQWRKRMEDLQKLKAAKDRSNEKDVNMEDEEIEVLWPNPDYVTDLVVYGVGQEPVPPEESPSK